MVEGIHEVAHLGAIPHKWSLNLGDGNVSVVYQPEDALNGIGCDAEAVFHVRFSALLHLLEN